ncbi:helix-turn-helix domain-containing protein [Echinicola jeungdonensis]|uniref:Helix-turn-helix domain-containing protein n=1 Tax=Echinicola jeungdonensis TaxID=709343 RepID=A0ABV5J2U4_9BACT|nr:helix-turn-helix domain-containing protein [Echinicola jeungdonensis]MDN3667984.1 helix-turn-helix domain-containing protein [Echinicola jeungdonensis]
MNSKEERSPRIVLSKLSREKGFPDDFQDNYHTHLLCHRGSFTFLFNDTKMKCKSGEFVFWFANSKLSELEFSKGFKATTLLVEKQFLNDNVPDQNLSIDAILHSRQYPVLQLNDQNDKQRVLSNFQLLYYKFQDKEHRFYEEALKLQMRLFILEMWHTFTSEFERRKRSLQTGTIYEQFMHLVQEHCMKEREVQFYADQLHITAKYLNYVSKQNSDITASEWIQRYTKERIVLLLENKNFNIAEIADEMGFSSRSFFTRYVKKILGVTPSEYRTRLE